MTIYILAVNCQIQVVTGVTGETSLSIFGIGNQNSLNWLIRTSNRFLTKNLLYLSTNSSKSENSIKPVVEYINTDIQKLDILRDNKNKSGIYR